MRKDSLPPARLTTASQNGGEHDDVHAHAHEQRLRLLPVEAAEMLGEGDVDDEELKEAGPRQDAG